MNPLTDIIPASWRKYVYAAFALAGVILGVCQIVGVETGKAAEVLAYLGVVLGATAASNTPAKVNAPRYRDAMGETTNLIRRNTEALDRLSAAVKRGAQRGAEKNRRR